MRPMSWSLAGLIVVWMIIFVVAYALSTYGLIALRNWLIARYRRQRKQDLEEESQQQDYEEGTEPPRDAA